MKPVDQTKFGEGGNCLAACIASLLDVDISEMPDTGHQGYEAALHEYLEPRGLVYVDVWRGALRRLAAEVPARVEEMDLGWQPMWVGPILCVLTGPSPRFRDPRLAHAVVGRSNGWMTEILHDPHPSRVGIEYVSTIGLLVPLDPAAHRGLAQPK